MRAHSAGDGLYRNEGSAPPRAQRRPAAASPSENITIKLEQPMQYEEYKSITDVASEIRAELKRRGISRRRVSVRGESYSLGNSINITIRDPNIRTPEIVWAKFQYERIDRDSQTGEILGGANRYVSIDYSADVVQVFISRWLPVVDDLVSKIESRSHEILKIENTGLFLGSDERGLNLFNRFQLICLCGQSHRQAAFQIGKRVGL